MRKEKFILALKEIHDCLERHDLEIWAGPVGYENSEVRIDHTGDDLRVSFEDRENLKKEIDDLCN